MSAKRPDIIPQAIVVFNLHNRVSNMHLYNSENVDLFKGKPLAKGVWRVKIKSNIVRFGSPFGSTMADAFNIMGIAVKPKEQ